MAVDFGPLEQVNSDLSAGGTEKLQDKHRVVSFQRKRVPDSSVHVGANSDCGGQEPLRVPLLAQTTLPRPIGARTLAKSLHERSEPDLQVRLM